MTLVNEEIMDRNESIGGSYKYDEGGVTWGSRLYAVNTVG